MSADTNRNIIRAIYEGAMKGDLSLLQRHLAADCVIVEADGLPYGGTYIGPQGLAEVFGKLAQTWDRFNFVPGEYIADGNYVVVLIKATGTSRKTGRSFELPLAEFWRFSAGKVVELRPFYWDTHALHQLDN